MHEHFRADADGELVPCAAAEATHTIVTREPEWDDSSRARAMRLDEYERSIDKETGIPIVEAFTKQAFVVHNDVVNHAARAIAVQRASDAEKHENDDHWFDGRQYHVEPYHPDAQD